MITMSAEHYSNQNNQNHTILWKDETKTGIIHRLVVQHLGSV
jgi:hypothetical protein